MVIKVKWAVIWYYLQILILFKSNSTIHFYSKTPYYLPSSCQKTKYSLIFSERNIIKLLLYTLCSVQRILFVSDIKRRSRKLKTVPEGTECIQVHLDNCICQTTYLTNGFNIQKLRLLFSFPSHNVFNIYLLNE